MYDITYNNKHSFNHFGLKRFNSKEHKAPSKNKIYETVPFMNGSYDFSNLYGSGSYSDRELNYSFLIEVENEEVMNYKKIDIENWLLGTNTKSILIDEDLKGYYYMAECTDINFDNYYSFGLIDVTFTAYPFKISIEYEGNVLWDNFDFETDIIQDVEFNISKFKKVSIYNQSIIDVIPIIIASSEFEIALNGKKYLIPVGESEDVNFKFKKGKNDFTIKGNGKIKFKFRKEVL